MNCSNCGAPLEAKSNICRFCGTVNDTDLRGIRRDIRVGPQGDRSCPRCHIKMNTIDLNVEGGFVIDRCATCLGIFFDPRELESLIDASVSKVYGIDHEQMAALIEEQGGVETTVTYVECPVCQELMNRRNYGARSGIVVDTCTEHGIWLDGGELGRILKWAKAGGRHHAEERKEEDQRAEQRKRRAEAAGVDRMYVGGVPNVDNDDMLPWGIIGVLLRLFG